MAFGPVVHVRGLRELQAAFAKFGPEVKRDLALALTKVGEIVARDAAQKAWSGIRNMDARWSKMRVGVSPSLVYVAPGARRWHGSPRPNLGTLLMTRAMQPALDEHEAEVVAAAEAAIDAIASANGF